MLPTRRFLVNDDGERLTLLARRGNYAKPALRAAWLLFACSPAIPLLWPTEVVAFLTSISSMILGVTIVTARTFHIMLVEAFEGGAFRPTPRRMDIVRRAMPGDGYRGGISRPPSLCLDGRVVPVTRVYRIQVTEMHVAGIGAGVRFQVSLVLRDAVIRIERFDDEAAARRFAGAVADLLEVDTGYPDLSRDKRLAGEDGTPTVLAVVFALFGPGIAALGPLFFSKGQAVARVVLMIVYLLVEAVLRRTQLRDARLDARDAAVWTFGLPESPPR
jgi:hypothetical protein